MSILFPSYSMGLFSLIIMILSFPIISLIIRRLHDSERNGSWILLILAPLFIAFGVWAYSYLFFKAGQNPDEFSLSYEGDYERQDMYILSNGDTVLFWPSARMQAETEGARFFEGTRNGNPIMIDPSVLQNAGRDQRVFYGTAGVVSFLFIFWLIGFIIMIVLCSARGTEGPNRYGPDPNAV